MFGQHLAQRLKQPVAKRLDKGVTDRETDPDRNQYADQTAPEIGQMVGEGLLIEFFDMLVHVFSKKPAGVDGLIGLFVKCFHTNMTGDAGQAKRTSHDS